MKSGDEHGNGPTAAASRTGPLTWRDLCLDPRFQDLPYKIELNGRGQIIMSPTRNFHGFFAFKIGSLMEKHLPDGEVIMECAVETADGTKEADAAWVSRNRWAVIQAEYSSSIAPEICAEVMSRSNTRQEMMQKKDLYLGAGAREYWLCHEDGKLEFFDSSGQLQCSKMCPKFPKAIRKT
jgi:Uma2 family endonuclease